jgi:hypothetical protein
VERFINLDLLKNPLNWATVVIMIAFGLLLLAIVSPQPDQS